MRRWRRVEVVELQAIWAALRARNAIQNECTHAELCAVYGPENLKHKIGYGWYKLIRSEDA